MESGGLYDRSVVNIRCAQRNAVNEDNEVNEIEDNEVNEVNEVSKVNKAKEVNEDLPLLYVACMQRCMYDRCVCM